MASNNFGNGKIHGASEAKAKFGYTTKDERLRRRHSNKKIDKTLTHLNSSVRGMLTGHEYTYSEMCGLYDARIAELDAVPGQSKRKDWVTLQAIETPAPADLPAERQDAWFLRVAQIEMDIFGEDNFLDGHIDRDEQHEYMDPTTKEMVTSRVHMVSFLFPVVADADGAPKLNAKRFSRRANINRLNKAVEEMSVSEFDVHFMTGKKTKSTKTVEQLKEESRVAELEARAEQAEQAAQALQDALRWHDAVVANIEAKRKRSEELDAEISEKEGVLENNASRPSPNTRTPSPNGRRTLRSRDRGNAAHWLSASRSWTPARNVERYR